MLEQLKQHQIPRAETSLGRRPTAYYSEGVYLDPEIAARFNSPARATLYYFGSSRLEYWNEYTLAAYNTFSLFPDSVGQTEAKEYVRSLVESLCDVHPAIEMTDRIKGVPVIKGSRLSVGQILGRINALHSIDAVVSFYQSSVSEDQVKAALAFTQDFLEAVCEPLQVDG